MNETDLKKKIKVALPKDAWHYAPVQTGMGAGGIPDIIVCQPYKIMIEDLGKTLGLFVGIEAKMKGNKPSALQTTQLKGIAAAGGKALVITQNKKGSLDYKVETIK